MKIKIEFHDGRIEEYKYVLVVQEAQGNIALHRKSEVIPLMWKKELVSIINCYVD